MTKKAATEATTTESRARAVSRRNKVTTATYKMVNLFLVVFIFMLFYLPSKEIFKLIQKVELQLEISQQQLDPGE